MDQSSTDPGKDTFGDTPDYIFNVTTDGFQKEVLDRSQEVPVVVDFWATWCGPCRMLGPVLERVIGALGGRVALAKVDTDSEPQLAQRYRISGIPAVKAFYKGRLVNEFVGARDQRFVATFLESLIPSPSAEVIAQATELLAKREFEAAAKLLKPLVEDGQALDADKRDQIRLMLAEIYLTLGPAHYGEVPTLLDGMDPRSTAAERAELFRQVLAFFKRADEAKGDELERLHRDEKDADARLMLAAVQARSGDYAGAFENLLWLVANNRRFDNDAGKRVMLLLFQYLGSENPDVHEYRRRLQVIL